MKEFCKLIGQFGYKYDRWQIWSDFLEISALSIANVFYRSDDMEQQYMSVISRYDKKEVELFPRLLTLVVNGLTDDGEHFRDYLGECFHELELHNKCRGQFFTPYSLSVVTAQTVLDDIDTREGIITLDEPACGSGSMVLAACEVAASRGVNYQRRMFFRTTDIDRRCFYMAYIQLALCSVPALVQLGDTLRLTVDKAWFTPMYFMAGMDYKRLFSVEKPEQEEVKEPIQGQQLAMFNLGGVE